MSRPGQFTSKRDGMGRAKKFHYCMACRFHCHSNWGDRPCASCGREKTRVCFDSEKEMKRGAELLLLSGAGKIANLRFHPRFDLKVNGLKVCTYTADADYYDENGRYVVEDVKPKGDFMTKESKIKIALFEAINRSRDLTVTLIR